LAESEIRPATAVFDGGHLAGAETAVAVDGRHVVAVVVKGILPGMSVISYG
jgi:hypothetical protein